MKGCNVAPHLKSIWACTCVCHINRCVAVHHIAMVVPVSYPGLDSLVSVHCSGSFAGKMLKRILPNKAPTCPPPWRQRVTTIINILSVHLCDDTGILLWMFLLLMLLYLVLRVLMINQDITPWFTETRVCSLGFN